MESIQLFQVASRQAEWLSVRQSTVSGNIANANTPGFRAMDVAPFNAVLDNTNMPMATTNPLHFTDATTDQYVVGFTSHLFQRCLEWKPRQDNCGKQRGYQQQDSPHVSLRLSVISQRNLPRRQVSDAAFVQQPRMRPQSSPCVLWLTTSDLSVDDTGAR